MTDKATSPPATPPAAAPQPAATEPSSHQAAPAANVATAAAGTKWRQILVALVATAAVGLWFLAQSASTGGPVGDGRRYPAVGHKLPSIQLEDLDRGVLIEREDLAGQVVLINFWGTWCLPCEEELPHLSRLATTWAADERFRLVPVACEAPDTDIERTAQESRAFLNDRQLDFPVIVDPDGLTRRALVSFTQSADFAYPTTVLLDPTGTVRGVWLGYRPGLETVVAQRVAELFRELDETPAEP